MLIFGEEVPPFGIPDTSRVGQSLKTHHGLNHRSPPIAFRGYDQRHLSKTLSLCRMFLLSSIYRLVRYGPACPET